MMDCGARAFDWRPKLDKDGLIMHHGGINVNHPMGDALDDMTTWATKHPGVEDLVFLMITDCEGSAHGQSCTDAVKAALSSRHITYITDCSTLKNMNVSQAHQRAKLPGGGAILAVFDCWESYYDSSIACSGYKSDDVRQMANGTPTLRTGKDAYTCYNDSSTKAFPLQRMWEYVNKTTDSGNQP